MKNSYLPGVLVSILFIFFSVSANAVAPVITNGSFTGTVNTDTTTPNAAPGWTVTNSTPEVVGETAPTNNTGLPWVLSPDGGTFAKLNGTLNPVSREAIEQTISGFTIGETYELYFFQTNLGWYWAKFNEWYDHEGYLEFYIDDILVGQSTVVQAPSNFDQPNQWSSGKISFVAAAETQTLRIGANTTATVPDPSDTSNSSLTTAYMAVDGVRFFGEVCANGIDDDGDGLVDGDDPDCESEPPPPPNPDFVDMKVRCLHEPLFPASGESVTVRASVIDGEGAAFTSQFVEIYVDQNSSPTHLVENQSETSYTFTPSGDFRYGCRAANVWETATSWHINKKALRAVDVGALMVPELAAIPIGISGVVSKQLDVVFFADDNEYSSFTDPQFQSDVYSLIYEGYFTIPWFVEHQWLFNFWIATDSGDASPNPDNVDQFGNLRCFKTKPENFDEDYSWADTASLVHTSNCRDGAAGGAFSIEMESGRLQVVAHETGHSPFGLSDEYRNKPKGYFEKDNFPNVFKTEQDCIDNAVARTYEASDCRLLATDSDNQDWWLGEPDYGTGINKIDEVKDLMQQTGGVIDLDGNTLDRYKVGNSERDPMGWFVARCRNGDC